MRRSGLHPRVHALVLGGALMALAGMPAALAQNADPVSPGNPLWAIPLNDLAATRERPVFSPSRRPPPPPVVAIAAPVYVPPPPPPKPARPQLELVGTVITAVEDEDETFSTTDGLGIFLDQTTNTVVRIRTGETHNGWVLRSVQGRGVTLQRDRDTVVLSLPTRDTEQASNPAPSFSAVRPSEPGRPPRTPNEYGDFGD